MIVRSCAIITITIYTLLLSVAIFMFTCMQVKVQKQFPLTSIIEIVYNEKENPRGFILQFGRSEILLEARDKFDCQIWVKYIQEGA